MAFGSNVSSFPPIKRIEKSHLSRVHTDKELVLYSYYISALTLLDQSWTHLTCDASVGTVTDFDAWYEWCNWNPCIPSKRQF